MSRYDGSSAATVLERPLTSVSQLCACCADTVADRSGRINGKLQSRRDHIDELNAVRVLLVKLQVCLPGNCAHLGAVNTSSWPWQHLQWQALFGRCMRRMSI